MHPLKLLEADEPQDRLQALEQLIHSNWEGLLSTPFTEDVNNHVHTRYSFSPYSPSSVAYLARKNGLRVVGSVDHDSLGAAEEMKHAAALLGIGGTVGVEVRVSFAGTPFENRRLNNPDTLGNGYIVLHGIPQKSWDKVREWLNPIHTARDKRNRQMVGNANTLLEPLFGRLDYDTDIVPLSWKHRGGSVTERHILYGIALRIIARTKKKKDLAAVLQKLLPISIPDPVLENITDETNPYQAYDLLGLFKAEFLPQIFIQPNLEECPPVQEVTALARVWGSIPAYAYLGDVTNSPTGDKKAEKFEDSFLEELFNSLPTLGFQAVTYMPPRNSLEQLKRVQFLASRHGLMEISGVDINNPRQQFPCPEIRNLEFRHLIETTWALVGHEVLTFEDPRSGLFGETSPYRELPLSERIQIYARIGKQSIPNETFVNPA